MLKTALIGLGAIAVLAGSPALAADMAVKAPPPVMLPVYSWTGFYIGAQAGYGLSDYRSTFSGFDAGDTPPPQSPHGDGFVGGGEVGYNFQSGKFVVGVEADISYADMRGRATGVSAFGIVQTVEQKIDWLGTVRGRLGVVPVERLLLFATGGVAFGGTGLSGSDNPGVNCAVTSCGAGSTSSTNTGWTAGGGIEYAWSNQLSLKAEYLHVDLGSNSLTYPVTLAVSQSTTRAEYRADIVRFGINWKLGAYN
ncbi:MULTISPECIES: outer membrane protein [Bradyrhizobium]|jgi:outer membrane immunogenic protein|uniref:outer membrane protein n=1 Tax=Bradyrhizobium TaxID=374 RepID=UPI00042A241B|nr:MULTISPECIES: outer membrane protein [Bradyrhizobium]AUC93613.1 porin family protein [Bradyrhizobium sp. SK17]MBK5655704.1 porin family protein [Rhizobium sp.]OCX32137.1 hypothetical protein QU42_05795 [Bradyrhizobium sp. UASWS1016]